MLRSEVAINAPSRRAREIHDSLLTEIQEIGHAFAFAELLPHIVMLSDENRHFVYANKRYQEYTGLTVDKVPTQWRDVIHPDDLPAVDGARMTGTAYELEYRLRRASDGVYRWHYARIEKIPGGGGWLGSAIDIDDRRRAEESLRFIERAGSLLSQSLDLETTFATLLDLMVPDFGDWATINMRDDHGIKTIALRHSDPTKAHLVRRLTGAYYHNEQGELSTPAVYRTGVPQLMENVGEDVLRTVVKPDYLQTVVDMGAGSLVSLPILRGKEVVGTFGIVTAGARRKYTESDLPPLKELARRASSAIQNARLYEREHRVAEALQQAALPRSLPVVDGLEFDGYYRAGREDATIGGDWYDAFQTADGRVVITVGDVAGSGLEAAVAMANLRQNIRCAAHIYTDPSLILDAADLALRNEQSGSMATAVVCAIDLVRKTLRYASAGHLPILVRAADGRITELVARGMPLGYRSLASNESRTFNLAGTSQVILFTDGLVESSHDILGGEQRLRDALNSLERKSAVQLVQDMLVGAQGRDDVATLIVSLFDPSRLS